jgi:hypothetical protein
MNLVANVVIDRDQILMTNLLSKQDTCIVRAA